MASKLAVLKPRKGSAAGPPRVLADASLALSFALPAGFTRPAAAAARVRAPGTRSPSVDVAAQTGAASSKAAAARDAWSDDDGDDHESWETRGDFSVDVQMPPKSAARDVEGEEEADDDDETRMATTFAALEVGGWEEQDALALPDDFPLLLVNLTRLQREHFPPEPRGEQAALSSDEMRQLFELVKQTLHRHFTQMVEVLFEQKSCFHCTYGTSRAMLANLHAAYPDDVFGMVDYPPEVQGIELSEFLHVLSRPSRWKSVDYLKDCLRRCSRDIKWKLDVALELDVLAEKEHEIFTAEQDRLSAEIDDLTRLRDSFKDKLAKLAAREGVKSKNSSQEYLLLRKLEDIETRLVALLDAFLQEPELQEHECDGMFAGGADGLTTGMNVLDMVVAMVFSRLPRDFSQQLTSEEHFQSLLDHHIHIRRLWKRDFGRLPPRTNAAAYASHSDDNDDDDDERRTRDVSDDDNGDKYGNDSANDDKYDNDADNDDNDDFQRYERVELSSAVIERRHAGSSSDSWESVHADDIRDDGVRIEWIGDDAEREESKSDGYGADDDSDGSGDAPAGAKEPPSRSPRRAATSEPRSTGRRVRVRKAAASGSSVATPAIREEAQEPNDEKATKKKKKKKSKATTTTTTTKKKSKSRTAGGAQDDDVPFQPFACTGALSLLRLAKENELF